MVARSEIYWADLGPPAGRRPVCVLTRDAAIPVVTSVVCALITRTIRHISSEVPVGAEAGLLVDCVISCDNLVTVQTSRLDPAPVGRLDLLARARVDQSLLYALDILV